MSNQLSRERIGVLGGSFDPLHWGHLKPTEEVAQELGFTKIKLMPAFVSPLKSHTNATPAQRVEMIDNFCQTHPLFETDKREIIAEQTSYTVESLSSLKREMPECQLNFFMGMDSLLSFHKWYRWQDIVEMSNLIVTERPGYQISQLPEQLESTISSMLVDKTSWDFEQSGNQVFLCTNKMLNISSTEIRQRISQNLPCADLLPASVIRYIKQHSLYQHEN